MTSGPDLINSILQIDIGFPITETDDLMILDDTVRGKLDTGTLSDAATDLFTNITQHGRHVTVDRGAQRADNPILIYNSGTGSVELDNRSGNYDPFNLLGPYVAAGETQIIPMRPMRIRGTYAGVGYPLYWGYTDAVELDFDISDNIETATFPLADGFQILEDVDRLPSATVGAGEDVGARINRILDSAGWPTLDRLIATGDSTLQATDLSGTALAEIQEAMLNELGEFYIDASGRAYFRNRQAIFEDVRSNTAQAIFGDAQDGIELPFTNVTQTGDRSTVINRINAQRVGGAVQFVEDTVSQGKNRIKDYNKTDLILQTDADVLQWASFLLFIAATAEQRFTTLEINPLADPDNLFPQVLGREIGDRITIRRRPGHRAMIERDAFIRGIHHDITPNSWKTTFDLQSATKYSFFTLDIPELAALDSVALAY